MAPDAAVAAKLEDFARNPGYERRVVAFYDFLGWRSKIAEAGDDPAKIGNLRRMILRHVRSLAGVQVHAAPAARFTSFSDNIVVSYPIDVAGIVHLLTTLGSFQIASAGAGFLVRGGVTVGNIFHDELAVFGPALNRAYELESEIADLPRIVVDEDVLKLLPAKLFFMKEDQGIQFIDPLTVRFIRKLTEMEQSASTDIYSTIGLPGTAQRNYRLRQFPADILLKKVLEGLKPLVRSPLGDKEWRKVSWLYDRVATQLGVPHSGEYRVKPGDAGGSSRMF